MPLLTANGTWVEAQTVSTPVVASGEASTPRGSMGIPATRA